MKTRTMFLTIMSCLFVGLAAGALRPPHSGETADLLPEGTFTNGIEYRPPTKPAICMPLTTEKKER